MSATVFKFRIHNEDNQVYFCKQNQDAKIFFAFFFLFSVFLSTLMFSVKDSSGTTLPRILKFGTKLGNEQL